MHILDLPAEILSAILSWVPCNDLVLNVPLVCKYFRNLLRTEWYWRMRYVDLSHSQPLEIFTRLQLPRWQRACLRLEDAVAEQKTTKLSGEYVSVCVLHISVGCL